MKIMFIRPMVVIGILCGLLVTPSFAATILLYHHVSDSSPKSTSVTIEQFQQHLELISALNLTVVPLTTITEAITSGKPVDKNWTAITFDDGYRNVYDNAFPLLKQRNWPFTVFVNPNMVKPSKLYMDWSQLKELTQHGGLIANHTLAHENLVRDGLSKEQAKQNLLTAEAMIQQEVGQSVKMLAYPYGEYNDEMKTMLREIGFIGFAQHSGAVNQHSDPQAITRFPANGIYANPKTLKAKLNSIPFAIKSITPTNTLPSSLQPELKVSLYERGFYKSQLSCFISGQSKPSKPVWLSDTEFTVTADSEIQSGRVKYNCTAPSIKDTGRYFWMSKLWINATE